MIVGESQTRREFLQSTAGTTIGVAEVTTSGGKRKPQTLFKESFESGTPTRFSPAARGKAANPGIVEAPGTAVDGEYMMRMGRVNSTRTTSPVELPRSDPFEVSVHVAPLTRGDYVPDAGMIISYGGSDITLFQMIDDAKRNRILGLNNTELGNFETDSWNHVQVRFESSGEEVQVSYTIDGDERGETFVNRGLFGEEINLELFVGYPTVLWDDITIVQNPDARNQGLLPSSSLFDAITTIGAYVVQAAFIILLLLLGIGFLGGLTGDSSSSGTNTRNRSRQRTKKSKSKSRNTDNSNRISSSNGSTGVRTNKYGELIEDDQK